MEEAKIEVGLINPTGSGKVIPSSKLIQSTQNKAYRNELKMNGSIESP